MAVGYLVQYGLHLAGKSSSFNVNFARSYAAGKAARWIKDNYGRSILQWISDAGELALIVQKSRGNMYGAQLDYRALKEKKARRIAQKIIDDNHSN